MPEGSTPPEVGRVGGAAAAAGHRPGRAARARGAARAGDGEGERRAAAVTFRLAGIGRRDREREAQRVVVEDGAGRGRGADGGPRRGLDSVTVKPSSGSTVVSPATLTVMVWLVWPAAKLTVPEGSTPPAKSVALAGAAPLPVTAQVALLVPVVHARAGDGEGERRAAAVAFRLAGVARR